MTILVPKHLKRPHPPTAAPGRHEFVIVSERLPVQLDPVAVRHAGAVAATLEPVAAVRRAGWVGWTGTAHDTAGSPQPFYTEDVWYHPVALTQQLIDEGLRGQASSAIAPLYHDVQERPVFNRRWRQAYRAVNERFAQTAAEVAAPGAVVWIHDYHLQLVPGLLRALRPDLLIGFYLHAPFPPPELFCRLPAREELLRGMLGADLVGFQRQRAAANFRDVAQELLGCGSSGGTVWFDGRGVEVDAFPSSIGVEEIEALARTMTVRAQAAALRAELGDPQTVLLAVDRLEGHKGIENRMTAFRELLAEGRLDPARTVLVQVATPVSLPVARHDRLRARVERHVSRINGTHALVGRPAVHYTHQALERDELVALYLAADVLVTTPLRDGASLVAKEFTVAHGGGPARLVLSEFTATAGELTGAVVVNPHDVEALKSGIAAAVAMDDAEAARRMTAMRDIVAGNDVRHWSGQFLSRLGGCAAAAGVRSA